MRILFARLSFLKTLNVTNFNKYKVNNMIPEHEKTWKELGYKSKKAYNEYLDDIYDDLRHGYI